MDRASRLCAATLADLPSAVARPPYDRAALRTGIVHLGTGAFHRAHQAMYTDAVLRDGDARWGILGASLRSPGTRDALAPQDGLYTLNVQGEASEYAVIGAVTGLLVAPESPPALLDALCRPSVGVVSLTVTEKAYCRDASSGLLDEAHPDIVHDLAHPAAPRSALGLLAAAIARRRAAGLAPFTVLCCDNLPANGETLHRLLQRFAALADPDLSAYVGDRIACPSTMVDRIVPATTDADRARASAALGVVDAWPVVAEPFTQWVIEDRFAGPRPAWDLAGAQFVRDVAPFETMKLRLLNGSHSALAYLGALAGHETVADAMSDGGIAPYVRALMQDAAATLAMPAGTDVADYMRALLDRFGNPALRHRTWQIAMDGSQKLPQRLLGPLRDRLGLGLPIARHALAVAAWMRFVAGIDERGAPIEVRDPMADELASIVSEAGPHAARLAPALLGVRTIFGDLGAHPLARAAVTDALERLTRLGASRAAGEAV